MLHDTCQLLADTCFVPIYCTIPSCWSKLCSYILHNTCLLIHALFLFTAHYLLADPCFVPLYCTIPAFWSMLCSNILHNTCLLIHALFQHTAQTLLACSCFYPSIQHNTCILVLCLNTFNLSDGFIRTIPPSHSCPMAEWASDPAIVDWMPAQYCSWKP